jgi:hypothetical protein
VDSGDSKKKKVDVPGAKNAKALTGRKITAGEIARSSHSAQEYETSFVRNRAPSRFLAARADTSSPPCPACPGQRRERPSC